MTRTDDVLSMAALEAVVISHGYSVIRETSAIGGPLTASRSGWHLLDHEGGMLLIGDHGMTSPTKRAALIEAALRIKVG